MDVPVKEEKCQTIRHENPKQGKHTGCSQMIRATVVWV
jgi:hypothetical protein